METTLSYLKESGIKIVAASEHAEENYFSSDLTGPVALLMGAEGSGISKSLLKLADAGIKIPMKGSVSSLNVSVAFGIIAFEVVRQRHFIR